MWQLRHVCKPATEVARRYPNNDPSMYMTHRRSHSVRHRDTHKGPRGRKEGTSGAEQWAEGAMLRPCWHTPAHLRSSSVCHLVSARPVRFAACNRTRSARRPVYSHCCRHRSAYAPASHISLSNRLPTVQLSRVGGSFDCLPKARPERAEGLPDFAVRHLTHATRACEVLCAKACMPEQHREQIRQTRFRILP